MKNTVKKIVIGVILLLSVSLCFAKGQTEMFEIGIGYHGITETQDVSGNDRKTEIPSFGINLGVESYLTEIVGIGFYGNILFPQQYKMSAQGQSLTIEKSFYDTFFSFDFLFGPVFMLYKSETIRLPVSAGVHAYYLMADSDSRPSDGMMKVGAGTNITGEYHFNQTIYAYARFQLTFDFMELSGRANTGSSTAWGIAPCIGIGFQR
jgi:hypothetical protein